MKKTDMDHLNTIIYKRAHSGDSDRFGPFGVHDCMGQVRRWNFEAVTGVGEKRPLAANEGIARKVRRVCISDQ